MSACDVCPHACALPVDRRGRCRSRRCAETAAGEAIVPEGYGRITALALDPIEKKPIARWRSGTTVLSLGSYGCNMNCPFCQNASIAQVGPDDVPWREAAPEQLVESALELAPQRCIGLAYTYNEPLVNWEFLRDTATLAHERGLANVLVSNGMASSHVIGAVAPLIDAANIDLKCFTEAGYRTLGGDLRTVMNTIEALIGAARCHVEVTTLVVPGFSDGDDEIRSLARWIAQLDPNIPYHLTRFFPQHRLRGVAPTPIPTLHRLANIAREHLNDVMLGNV